MTHKPGERTIPCITCGRPAAGQFDGLYYCKYHLGKKMKTFFNAMGRMQRR